MWAWLKGDSLVRIGVAVAVVLSVAALAVAIRGRRQVPLVRERAENAPESLSGNARAGEGTTTRNPAASEVNHPRLADGRLLQGASWLSCGALLVQPRNYLSSIRWPVAVVVGKVDMPDCPGWFVLRLDSEAFLETALREMEEYGVDWERVVLVCDADNASVAAHFAPRFSAALLVFDSPSNSLDWKRTARTLTPGTVIADWVAFCRNPLNFTHNMKKLPMAVIAGNDAQGTAPPPVAARLFVKAVNALQEHAPLTYLESPADIDDAMMKAALAWCGAFIKGKDPAVIDWSMGSTSDAESWWMACGQPDNPLKPARIKAEVMDERHVNITTENLRSFTFWRPAGLVDAIAPIFLHVDGQKLIVPKINRGGPYDIPFAVRRIPGLGWDAEENADPPERVKMHGIPVGLNQALGERLVFVTGTAQEENGNGNIWKEQADSLQKNAQNLLRFSEVSSVLDKEATLENLNKDCIVLLGGPEDNSVCGVFNGELPLGDVFASFRNVFDYDEPDVGYLVAFPADRHPKATMLIVVGGTGANGCRAAAQKLLDIMNGNATIQELFADFYICNANTAVIGVFGSDWSVQHGAFQTLPPPKR